MGDDDRELVERAAVGDKVAVGELLDRHLPRLRAWVKLRCGPSIRAHESASDVCQSICRDILENLDQFKYPGEAAFRAWLYATAARKVSDRAEYWGAARRDPARLQPRGASERESATDFGEMEAFRSICSPSQVAISRETMERIERAFARLDDGQREVVLSSRLAGLTHDQIGAQFGISTGAARTRLFRALGALAEALRDEGIAT